VTGSSSHPFPERERLPDLGARLARLADQAMAAGAATDRVQEDITALVSALLELGEYRSGNMDPRRQQSLRLAAAIERAALAGGTPEQLSVRFGLSKSQVGRLRRLHRARHHARVRMDNVRSLIEPRLGETDL
jgi:hypothetical protein